MKIKTLERLGWTLGAVFFCAWLLGVVAIVKLAWNCVFGPLCS